MFDIGAPPTMVDDSTLVNAIAGTARAEAQRASARMVAIAELVARRTENQGDRELWACDGWDEAAAEIGAALTIGRKQATTQMRVAVALRHRLRKVAAVFATGAVSAKIVSTICWRTRLVDDNDVLALLDTALAGAMLDWSPLSEERLKTAIDSWVQKFDPVAVLATRAAARARSIEFGKPDDETGTVSIWGALLAADGVLLDAALTDLAAQPCPADPRTVGQRRSDALAVLGARGDRLACLCGRPACPAAGVDARAAAVVIHVLTDSLPHPWQIPS